MKTVLIISPRFPPINAPDMHRVRQSLPYFEDMGWQPEVWHVDPSRIERDRDPLLSQTVPPDVPTYEVGALNPKYTRLVGLGSLALRSLPFYFQAINRRLARGDVDLIYFSTTAFPVMVLGRYWKRRFGVSYVIDMQDPWHNEYYLEQPPDERPPKYWFSYRLHKYLEPVAMASVDGIISVSEGYCNTLCERYPNVEPQACTVIPFGAAAGDFEVMEASAVTQPIFKVSESTINIVYAGRGGHDMAAAANGLFEALARGRQRYPQLFERIRMYFVGTSYAPDGQGEKTIEPLATEAGVADVVHEFTDRIPYFQALRVLRDADHLLIPGSDDPNYTASKLYPYILSRRPVLAVFHEHSSVVDILRTTNAGVAVTFNDSTSTDALAGQLLQAWKPLLEQLPFTPDTNWEAFEPYTAREMTRRQVEVFDRVVST